MKFSISVHADDGTQVDYTVNLLSSANAVSFINGWQAQQEAAQQEAAQQEAAQQSVQSDGACAHENMEAYEFGYYCKDCGMANPPHR